MTVVANVLDEKVLFVLKTENSTFRHQPAPSRAMHGPSKSVEENILTVRSVHGTLARYVARTASNVSLIFVRYVQIVINFLVGVVFHVALHSCLIRSQYGQGMMRCNG